jgi:hypothetical protein
LPKHGLKFGSDESRHDIGGGTWTKAGNNNDRRLRPPRTGRDKPCNHGKRQQEWAKVPEGIA